MKYFILESSVVNGQMANGVTVKDDINSARMVFHQIRASQLANSKVTYGFAIAIDEESNVIEKEMHGNIETASE